MGLQTRSGNDTRRRCTCYAWRMLHGSLGGLPPISFRGSPLWWCPIVTDPVAHRQHSARAGPRTILDAVGDGRYGPGVGLYHRQLLHARGAGGSPMSRRSPPSPQKHSHMGLGPTTGPSPTWCWSARWWALQSRRWNSPGSASMGSYRWHSSPCGPAHRCGTSSVPCTTTSGPVG